MLHVLQGCDKGLRGSRVQAFFPAKLQILCNHCKRCDSSDDVRLYQLFFAANLNCTCSIRNVLIEIWSVYEFQEVVNFHCVKPDPLINRLFHWDTGTFVISMKFSFAKFPFCYRLLYFVQFHQLLSGILVGINA